MLMVIFGAGASYDSVPHRRWGSRQFPGSEHRLPLANELFSDRELFTATMEEFPKCQPVVPRLRLKNILVEQELQRLQLEAEEDPERHRQLAAVRYYLRSMLWQCEERWGRVARGVTNYKSLLDQIRHWNKNREAVCLVTFNYDRMLEAALSTVGVEIKELSDYIASDTFKVVKLHGSVDWGREVETNIGNLDGMDPRQISNELIARAPALEISQRYRRVNSRQITRYHRFPLFPAIAIPVEKKATFECPTEQLDTLHACIRRVTRILVIGWRATEYKFLELLGEHLSSRVQIMVVAESHPSAGESIQHFEQAKINAEFTPSDGGFTDLVLTGRVDGFLRK